MKLSPLVIFLIGAVSVVHSLTIDGSEPTVTFQNTSPLFATYKTEFLTKMNDQVKVAFGKTLDTARANLVSFKQQKKLARAFGNANAYSVNSATLQGFQNYSLFAVASGFMVGVQAPSLDLGYYGQIAKDIKKNGDLYAGAGVGFSYLNLGINAGMLVPGLYVNAKYGALKQKIQDFDMDFSVMGFGVNYRLLDTKSLAGIIKWRGLSLGSGFYLQKDKLNIHIVPDSIETNSHFRQLVLSGSSSSDSASKNILLNEMGYTDDAHDARVILTPAFDMGLDVSTMTIPIDAVTGVSLLWGTINLTAGVGLDLNLGSSKVVLRGDSDARITSDTTKVTFTKATVKVDGSTTAAPNFSRIRIMSGLGLGLGPIKLDIPVIYYPVSGFAFGATVAVVW